MAIRGLKGTLRLPDLLDHFDTEGPYGQHLCLVLPVLSTDISRFRRSTPSKKLGFPTVKIIVAQVLEALVALHDAQIIHTGHRAYSFCRATTVLIRLITRVDLKPDNVLFNEGTTTESIRELLHDSPAVVDGEFELHGVRYPIIRSQPVPHSYSWNDPPTVVKQYSVQLTDLGHGIYNSCFTVDLGLHGVSAQWAGKEPTTRMISAYGLRAPEVILGANFDTKVDIWALGCIVSSTVLLPT